MQSEHVSVTSSVLSSDGRRSVALFIFFFFNDTATTEIYTLSLHDALPIPSHRPPMEYHRDLSAGGTWTRACRGLSGSGRLARPRLARTLNESRLARDQSSWPSRPS